MRLFLAVIVCLLCPTFASAQHYHRQWYNNDGLSLRQHAEVYHHTDTTGMSDVAVMMANDADHNRWGSGHHYASSTTVTRSRVVGRSCPNGVCPGVRTVTRVATAPVRQLFFRWRR